MPSDSFFFSIVRDPAALARSAFSYYKSVSSAFRKAPSLAAFLSNPQAFYRPGARGNHYARNLLWFDFGLPSPPETKTMKVSPQLPRDPKSLQLHIVPSGASPGTLFRPVTTAADSYKQPASLVSSDFRPSSFIQWGLAWLDSVFDLVMVAEYFDESLVLLADALCWSLDDVVGFMHNAQAKEASLASLKVPQQPALTPRLSQEASEATPPSFRFRFLSSHSAPALLVWRCWV